MLSMFFARLLSALLAQSLGMQFMVAPAEDGDQNLLAFREAGAERSLDEDTAESWGRTPPVGLAVCQTLHGQDSQVPYKFTALSRFRPYVCEEQDPLFEVAHSLFDWECAKTCLETPGCMYMQVFHNEKGVSTSCQGLRTCTITPSHDDSDSVSIYKRRADQDAARRKQAPASFLETFSVPARQRLLLYFDFDQAIAESDDDDAARRLSAEQSMASVDNATTRGSLDSCNAQGDCIKFTVARDEEDCAPPCSFTVCMTVDYDQDGCSKEGDISHNCKTRGGDDQCFDGNQDFSTWTDSAVSNDYQQCLRGVGGTSLNFLLKDGQSCLTAYGSQSLPSGASVSCQPRPADVPSCSGNREGVECIHTVALPNCDGTPASTDSAQSDSTTPAPTPSQSGDSSTSASEQPGSTQSGDSASPASSQSGTSAQSNSAQSNSAQSDSAQSSATTESPESSATESPESSASSQASAQGQANSARRRVSRRRTTVKDKRGKALGTLWNAGTNEEREHPVFGSNGKFGGFWSFKGKKTGIRVPQTDELVDYSVGPAATIVVVYRKDGYDNNMGRIFSGPNVDLYGYTKGMAMNMNGVRCLYADPILYDNEFHFIFIMITFATGLVEVYRDNVFLGNGTHGELIAEFDSIKYTFPWLIGMRYEYDVERTFDGDADEFAIFSYRFTEEDRDKYIDCGGACFQNCTDTDESLKLTLSAELSYAEFVDECQETCVTCVSKAVKFVAANYSKVDEDYIGVSYEMGDPPSRSLRIVVEVSVAPCTIAQVLPRLQQLCDIQADVIKELEQRECLNITFSEYANCSAVPNVSTPTPSPTWLPAHYHPRVLITPSDLPTIRTRLNSSWVAQEAKNTMASVVELNNTDSPYGQMYQRLLICDPAYMETLTTVEALLVNQRNNTEWIAYPDIYTMFMYSGLIALLDEENQTGQELGAALACHSDRMLLVYEPEDNNILNEDCEPALGLAYDYLYNFMSPEQHQPVRDLISLYTTGRVPFGTGMAGWQLGANGVGFFDGVVIQSLAIEYEEGWDSLVFRNDVMKQKQFYNWGVFDSGFTHEGWHYFMFAMEGAGPALLAAEIRGQGILGQTNALKAMTGAFYQMSPWTSGEQVKIFSYADGSGIGSPGRINVFFPIMKRLYPSEPVVDFMYNLQIEHQEDRKLTSDWMLFGLIPNSPPSTTQAVAEAANLSLTRFCPDSGRVIMRSDWTEDGMAVHFSARMDTYGLQKIHADINVLALFSHRRQWISDTDLAGTLKFEDEFNDMHSTILIDGLGQSGTSTMKTWPSLPGRILDFQDKGNVTYVVGDATLAYTYYSADYACGKSSRESCNADVGWGCVWDESVWGCVRNWSVGERAPFNMSSTFTWGQNNEAASMKTFSYPQFFNGSQRDLDSESEKWREQLAVCPINVKGRCWGGLYNPVTFAFRTVIMVRGSPQGPHPYVIVIDDIQAQDAQQHNYTISWQVRPHQDHWSRAYGDRDIKRWEANRYQKLKRTGPSEAVLVEGHVDQGEESLDELPELVVRLVGHPAEGPTNDEFFLVNEAGRHGQSGLQSSGYQRLMASRQTTLPKFKTIFYPRKQGDPELLTTYDTQGDTLTVTIGDTVDVLEFSEISGGRTVLQRMRRDNVDVLVTD